MISIRHLGAAPDDIEKDFDAAALVRTHSPGSQALGKGVRFRQMVASGVAVESAF